MIGKGAVRCARVSFHSLRCDFLCLQDTQSKRPGGGIITACAFSAAIKNGGLRTMLEAL